MLPLAVMFYRFVRNLYFRTVQYYLMSLMRIDLCILQWLYTLP